jgi:hypothetical protein
MALRKTLILRSPRSGRLEGRLGIIQRRQYVGQIDCGFDLARGTISFPESLRKLRA